jgi:transposase
MFSFDSHSKIFLAVAPVDLRKSFNGLWGLAEEVLGEKPRDGAFFVFTNRTHSRVKILAWDGTGVWVCAKRLEKRTFAWPKNSPAAKTTNTANAASGNTAAPCAAAVAPMRTKVRIEPTAFVMLLDGINLRKENHQTWFECE